MDDRLLALSDCRRALLAAGLRSRWDAERADPDVRGAQAAMIARLVAERHPDVIAALWTALSWHVVGADADGLGYPRGPTPSALYIGDVAETPAARYDDESGQRRAWRLLRDRVRVADELAYILRTRKPRRRSTELALDRLREQARRRP